MTNESTGASRDVFSLLWLSIAALLSGVAIGGWGMAEQFMAAVALGGILLLASLLIVAYAIVRAEMDARRADAQAGEL